MKDFFDRLDNFMSRESLNDNQLTVKAGLSIGALGKQRKGSRGLSNESIAKILHAYPELDANWLLTGKGEMIKSTPERVIHEVDSNYSLRTDRMEDKQIINLYELEATAGIVSIFEDAIQAPIDQIMIPNCPKCDGAIHIRGDSMYPILKSGDIVCYKVIQDITNIFWGEIYILDITTKDDQYLTIKYVQRSDKGDDYIQLISQNHNHQPIDVKRSYVRKLALVKASIRFSAMR